MDLAQPKNINPLKLSDLGFSKVLKTMSILILAPDCIVDSRRRHVEIDFSPLLGSWSSKIYVSMAQGSEFDGDRYGMFHFSLFLLIIL